MTGPHTPPTGHRPLREWDTGAAMAILRHRSPIITRGLIITARVSGFILGPDIIGHVTITAGDTIAAAGRIFLAGRSLPLRPHFFRRYDSLHPCHNLEQRLQNFLMEAGEPNGRGRCDVTTEWTN